MTKAQRVTLDRLVDQLVRAAQNQVIDAGGLGHTPEDIARNLKNVLDAERALVGWVEEQMP